MSLIPHKPAPWLAAALAMAAMAVLLPVAPAWAALTANADGTVTDSTTGLVWDRCSYGLSGSTCATGTAVQVDWPTALATATTANTAVYKGFNDWRVPNVKELESIVKIDTSNPAIDSTAFPATPTNNYFWTSTSYAPNPAGAWIVNFNVGNSFAVNTTYTGFVRLVRSGQSLAAYDALSAPNRSVTGATATASGNQSVSFTTPNGNAGCGFASTALVAANSVAPSLPAGVTFPHGMLQFATNNCGAGAILNLTVTLPSAVPAGTPYYKYGKTAADPTPHWYTVPATLNGAGTQYTFSITDGGLGDDDLTANGVISDPGGPGLGGGAGDVSGVPTLGEWGLLLLMGLMGLFGMTAVRRRG